MENPKIAVFAVNGEVVLKNDKKQKVIFMHSNSKEWGSPIMKGVPIQKFRQARPGEYFKTDKIFGVDMLLPREEDIIFIEIVNGYTIIAYKMFYYNGTYFENGNDSGAYEAVASELIKSIDDRITMPSEERVFNFITSLFKGKFSVRGKTVGQTITFDTPCHDFFLADIDGVAMSIGLPIEKRFGLEKMGFENAVVFHSYNIAKDDPFWDKYPKQDLGTNGFTLKRFCEMVYDLIKKKHNCV